MSYQAGIGRRLGASLFVQSHVEWRRTGLAGVFRRFYGGTPMTRRSRSSTSWPDWWDWELELTPHLEQRMEERDFTEVDVREMLEAATGFEPDVVEGRFEVECVLRGRSWHVIVEPDPEESLLVVVTAYRVG